MHGTMEKRGRKAGNAKSVRALGARTGRQAKQRPVPIADDQPVLLKISARLNRALSKLEMKSGRSKHYHVRRALERYVEDTWDYLTAVESWKSSRRTYSMAEVKKRLGLDG